MLARVRVALGPIADRLFGQARRDGRREDPAAYAFDALVELADGGEDDERAATPVRARPVPMRFRAVIRVDYEALVRGCLDGDETARSPGSTRCRSATARDLLGEATLHLVVTKVSTSPTSPSGPGSERGATHRVAVADADVHRRGLLAACGTRVRPRRPVRRVPGDRAPQRQPPLRPPSRLEDPPRLGPGGGLGPATDGGPRPPRPPQEPACSRAWRTRRSLKIAPRVLPLGMEQGDGPPTWRGPVTARSLQCDAPSRCGSIVLLSGVARRRGRPRRAPSSARGAHDGPLRVHHAARRPDGVRRVRLPGSMSSRSCGAPRSGSPWPHWFAFSLAARLVDPAHRREGARGSPRRAARRSRRRRRRGQPAGPRCCPTISSCWVPASPPTPASPLSRTPRPDRSARPGYGQSPLRASRSPWR